MAPIVSQVIYSEGTAKQSNNAGTISVVPGVTYTVSMEILRNDLGEPNERVSNVTFDGNSIGGCNPDGGDYDCTFYTCPQSPSVSSTTGIIAVNLVYTGHSWDCDCDKSTWECSKENTVSGRTPMTAVARFTLIPQVNVLTYSYTYTADPLGCCADANNNRYYDDPANSILNDGVTDDMITISNSVNRLDQSMPILDFGMLKTVHFVDVSYIVAWGKPALQSLKFSGANSADSFTEDLTTTDGFVSGDGGHTTTITGFRSWGCIRYLRIDDQLPKISVLSEIRVSGTDCEAATAAPAKLPLP